MKIIALNVIFVYRNRKIANLGKHVCQNAVAMITSSSRQNNLSYQIISRLSLDKLAKFGSVWFNLKKVLSVQSQRGHFPLPPVTIFLLLKGKHGGNESEKASSDCTENDGCHGDRLDPWICVGFLSNSLFGISIRHHQQLSG